MRPAVLLLSSLLLLSSCSFFKAEEYMPEYLREDSPLDPPGTAAARAALRAKYLKEGTFSKGDRPEVAGGRILLCNRNPERDEDISARSVKTGTVKIIACEGEYYFVEADGGERGYAKETDLINPNALVPLGQDPFGPLLPGDGELIPGEEGGITVGDGQRVMQDSDGRSVIVTAKKTDRSAEFEARERALQGGRQFPSAPVDDEPGEELPASSLDR